MKKVWKNAPKYIFSLKGFEGSILREKYPKKRDFSFESCYDEINRKKRK
ncbi:hypothetical protein [Ammoniphilus resinae]|nr:hypothetical protein [Ammoniphilus resinae]